MGLAAIEVAPSPKSQSREAMKSSGSELASVNPHTLSVQSAVKPAVGGWFGGGGGGGPPSAASTAFHTFTRPSP